ncbi:MAG: hypothetical protein AB7U20_05590, partial [Planctomycetaceae bacterium]
MNRPTITVKAGIQTPISVIASDKSPRTANSCHYNLGSSRFYERRLAESGNAGLIGGCVNDPFDQGDRHVHERIGSRGHQYLTIVMDWESGAVVHVGDGKGSEALKPFW